MRELWIIRSTSSITGSGTTEMAQTRIVTYRQDRPADWLKDHPHETWRCDIYPGDPRLGSDHHGIGEVEAEAIINASMAYLRWTKSRKEN